MLYTAIVLCWLLVVLLQSAYIENKLQVVAFQHPSSKHHINSNKYHHRCKQQSITCLNVVRRPLRPASTEKKRAERKAVIESRQNDALESPR